MSNLNSAVAAARELARRQMDGLLMYRSIDPRLDPSFADQTGLFRSQSSECLIRGGNRSGKSINAAALTAAIARDMEITTWDGKKIDCRRKHQQGRELQIWIIGLKIDHFSTIHRLLFRAGVYKMIKDRETGSWRAWRPWEPDDYARIDEIKPAPPFIPASEVDPKSWTWESKSSRQFTHVHLPGKAEIWCFPSTAREPRQGEPVDVIWIDEAIEYPDHYTEWQMRVSDERGRIYWSSWPRKGNTALVELKDRAQEQKIELERGEREKADVEEFVFVFENNPFIPADEKRKRKEGMSEEEWRARNFGEFVTENSRIYPFFDKDVHCAVPYDSALDDPIAKILRQNNGIPPVDWTHELILDPGTTKPCLLLGAIPPTDLWTDNEPTLVIYRELYAGRKTAWDIAEQLFKWNPRAEFLFNRWIIDNQAGRRIPEGHRESIATNYSARFKEWEVSCLNPGPAAGFHIGNPEFPIRREMVENALRVGKSGYPRLRIVNENCPNTAYQLANNQLAMQGDFVLERANEREKNDCRVCVEYWIASNPTYVPPASRSSGGRNAWDDFGDFWKDMTSTEAPGSKSGGVIRIGPGAAA